MSDSIKTSFFSSRLLKTFCLFLFIQGCSFFGGDEEEAFDQPAELIDFTPSLDVDREWKTSIGKGHEGLDLMLRPDTDGETIYAASFNGNVVAINMQSGRKLWSESFDVAFTAGPTYRNGILVLGTNDGELLALDSMTGDTIWMSEVTSEVLAPVAIKDESIFVRAVDGNLMSYSTIDGSVNWTSTHDVPRLSLRGTSAPVVISNAVICGFDDGKVTAYDLTDGSLLWETMLTPPGGRTEIEKVSDIDAPLVIYGNEVYAGSYQGALAALAIESGNIIWLTEASLYAGMDVDDDVVFASEANGTIRALSRFTGREVWKKETLLHRYPTAPAIIGDAIVVGDLEGYLHWLNKEDGEMLQRASIGSDKITSSPLVIGDSIYVQTDGGNLFSVKAPNESSR